MWYLIENSESIPSPGLIVYRDRVVENIARMISIAGSAERLFPHVKTHKMAAVTQLYLDAGVSRFKCATIKEAAMLGQCGADEALLSHQPVGPNVALLIALIKQFPGTRFSTIVDDARIVETLSAAAIGAGVEIDVWMDVDVGMHRTGIAPAPESDVLYAQIGGARSLRPAGLHVYDGHIRDSDLAKRTELAAEAFVPVLCQRDRLVAAGLPVPRIIAGGTPTFPIHAQHADRICSPGTCIFWDEGYRLLCPDLEFQHAALLLTRVISKPTRRRVCVDLGHKAIAAEMPLPRVRFLGWEDVTQVSHSEEHLVLETDRADQLAVGDVLYGVPYHICPTVALHPQAAVIVEGRRVDTWEVTARDRVCE